MQFTRKVDYKPETGEIIVGYVTDEELAAGIIGATREAIIISGNFHITRIEDMQTFQKAITRCVVHKLHLASQPPIIGTEPKTLTDEEADAEIAKKRKTS